MPQAGTIYSLLELKELVKQLDLGCPKDNVIHINI